MENLSMNKKIGLGAGLLMLISCFLAFVGAGEGDNAVSYSMWDMASGSGDLKDSKLVSPVHYLYLVLAAGALFFTWTDNFKFARIAFGAVLVLFLIQYFTGVSYTDFEESKGKIKPEDMTLINGETFDNAQIGLWLLLGSAAAGGFFSKE